MYLTMRRQNTTFRQYCDFLWFVFTFTFKDFLICLILIKFIMLEQVIKLNEEKRVKPAKWIKLCLQNVIIYYNNRSLKYSIIN